MSRIARVCTGCLATAALTLTAGPAAYADKPRHPPSHYNPYTQHHNTHGIDKSEAPKPPDYDYQPSMAYAGKPGCFQKHYDPDNPIDWCKPSSESAPDQQLTAEQTDPIVNGPGAPPPPPPPPDPAVLAQRARRAIPLVAPGFHMAPHDPQYDYVGLDTWLWTDPWQPQQATVTVRQTSVTLVGQPVRVWFDMENGKGTTCHDQGRPWVSGMTDAAKTDCSFAYDQVSQGQQGGKFTINAALVYRLTWTCSGVCTKKAGDMGEADGNEAHAKIRVDERQSVVTGGN